MDYWIIGLMDYFNEIKSKPCDAIFIIKICVYRIINLIGGTRSSRTNKPGVQKVRLYDPTFDNCLLIKLQHSN